ncbi:MAG TPA: hypothetical protein VGW39_00130 [Chthoniobacterales bacterium]|nr:hypothetical protein [Chthoniobacterales bacterium]
MAKASFLACLVLLFVAGIASGQTAPQKPLPAEPHEKYDDAPAPLPLWGTGVSPGMISQEGPFTSRQVNVNLSGQNITGDAANEPSIAVDPTDHNRMVIGWRQFNSVTSNFRQGGWGYTSNAGTTWTFPGVLENNVFRSDPVLDSDDTGRFYFLSLLQSFDVTMWRSINGGQNFTNIGPAKGGDKQWFVIDNNAASTGHGFHYQFWDNASPFAPNEFSRSTDGGFTWMNPITIPNAPQWGTPDVDSNGVLFFGGVTTSKTQFWCLRSTNARNGAVTPTFDQVTEVNMGGVIDYFDTINPEGLIGQVFLAVDRSGTSSNNNVYMLASVQPTGFSTGSDVMFVRSTDSGVTFSSPKRVNDDPINHSKWHWFGTFAVAPNGRIDSVWLDTRNAANNTDSQLFYSYSIDAGATWSANVAVSIPFNPFLGYPNQNKLGDYMTIVSDNTGGDVAYAATFNSEQDVYYVRVAPGVGPTPACTNDTWTPTSINSAPSARAGHTAVWTGSEMIVWGGQGSSGFYANTGGKYDPGADSWVPTSITGAPSARAWHTAVWTGSEMIVWGGFGGAASTGGRYNPATDSWTATSLTNAPAGRSGHTAVWTGSEMIVWGGTDGGNYLNTGGRYNPTTDSWTPMSTTSAPTGRDSHSTVWTGSQMIVWGGTNNTTFITNTGGSYNPGTDSWTATSTTNVPSARVRHTAVWTGSEMIVWGGMRNDGVFEDTGGNYDPSADSWAATSTTNAPVGRTSHSAVWTGSEMIVWGGGSAGVTFNTGGRYHRAADSWLPTTPTGAPMDRSGQTAVWTGGEMIVWGGSRSDVPRPSGLIPPLLPNYFDSGGRYCAQQPAPPASPTPTPTPTPTSTPTPTLTPSPTPATPTPTPTPTPTSTPTPTPSPSPAPMVQAINLSTRMRVQTGDNVGIGGFIITGSAPKRVIVRAIGPSLTQYGVPDALADPVMELNGPSSFATITNDNWRDTQAAEIKATFIPPANVLESAIVATLAPGAYTAIVSGKDNTSGVALVEVYDLDHSPASKLANLSTRAFVSTADNIVIAGFVLNGVVNDRIVLRGLGPSLTALGVPGALADPTLELRDNNGALVIANNDWQDDPAQAAELTAAGLAPTDNLESGIAATLPPGLYTALLAGLNNGSGIGLVEVYDRGAP